MKNPWGGVTEKGVPVWRLASAVGEPKRKAGYDAEMSSLPRLEGQGPAGVPNNKIIQKVDKKKQKHGGAQLPILPKNTTRKTAGLTMPDCHEEAAHGPTPHVTHFCAIPAAEPPWGQTVWGRTATPGDQRGPEGVSLGTPTMAGSLESSFLVCGRSGLGPRGPGGYSWLA